MFAMQRMMPATGMSKSSRDDEHDTPVMIGLFTGRSFWTWVVILLRGHVVQIIQEWWL